MSFLLVIKLIIFCLFLFVNSEQQQTLFERVERILDMDQLGRLAVATLPNECLRRNAIIEKSVSRMRAALASVHWESRLTSWLHILLMTHLPSDYMVSYIDILQTLKRKIPTLVDKMLYHKPIEMHKDYLSAIMKRPWQPSMVAKTRTLPSNPVIVMVMVSSTACSANTSSRERRWLNLLATLTCVESITVNQVLYHRKQLTFEWENNCSFENCVQGSRRSTEDHRPSDRTTGCIDASQNSRDSQSNAKS